MQSIPMVDLRGQYERIKEEMDARISSVVHSTRFIGGPEVTGFSGELANYLGSKSVVPCANGTDALQIALMALPLEKGDEVITTAFTFVATVEVVALLGLKPVFVDIEYDTFNLDPEKLEAAITEKTRCIIPVHLFGQCCKMERIMEIADKHGLYVIEDNAQAIGSDYHFANGTTVKSGCMGHIGTTSFFPSKNLGCYGDGGAVFTNDGTLAQKMAWVANHGMEERYYHKSVGINSRLDAIQAAVLSVKLKYLDEYGKARQAVAARYDEAFASVPALDIPGREPASTHVFHQYTLRAKGENPRATRQRIMDALSQKHIASAIYYPVPLHLQEAYMYYGHDEGDLPITEQACREVFSLPIHTEMSHEDQDIIIRTVKEAI